MGPRRRLILTLLQAVAAGAVVAPLDAVNPRGSVAAAQTQAQPDARQPQARQPEAPDLPPTAAGSSVALEVDAGAAQPAADPPATAPAIGPPTAPAGGRGADVAGDLQRLVGILRSPAARQSERDEAAARLVSRQSVDADADLRDALASGAQPGRLAVARAVVDDPTPSLDMIEPLSGLLGGGEPPSAALAEAAANALAGYRRQPAALRALIEAANNANAPPFARLAAIRAMGRVVERESAQVLVQLVNAPSSERRDVRDAAADGLVEMTGLADFGRDPRRWTQWWMQSNVATNPDAWRADLLERRAARLDRTRRRYASLLAELKPRLERQYLAADTPEKRQAMLLDLLGSGEPEIRGIATDFVTAAMQDREDISPAVRDRLVAMVGDSDPQVRLRTAETLYNMNYPGALGALLTQLAQEREDRVRIALVNAVTPIKDPAAVPVLLDVIGRSTSAAVTTAALRALGASAQNLRATNPALANQVAARLRGIALRPVNRPPAAEEVRVGALNALAPLRDPNMLDRARLLLGESPLIRQATLRLLGDLGDPRAAAVIADMLQARDPAVRKLALDALGKTPNGLDYYQTFFNYMQPRREADAEVREAAWQALRAALPGGTDQQVAETAQLFRNDPNHHIHVAHALAERLLRARKMGEWAFQLENIAEDELKLSTPRPAEAAGHFEEALNYWLQNNGDAQTIDKLTRKVVQALLAAGQYPQAAAFAQKAIARQWPAAQEVVGPIIKHEADRLRTTGETRSALQLIDAALKMNPPLGPRHEKDLKLIRSDIEGGGPVSDGIR